MLRALTHQQTVSLPPIPHILLASCIPLLHTYVIPFPESYIHIHACTHAKSGVGCQPTVCIFVLYTLQW